MKLDSKTPAKPGWWLRIVGDNRAELKWDPADLEHVRITIHEFTAGANYDLQLNQSRYEVVGGANYRITFRGRADTKRDVSIGFSMAIEPWSSLGLYRQIWLTPEWLDYSEDFTATCDNYFGRIHFDLGNVGISVDLSSVRLWQVSDSGVTQVERIGLRPLPRSTSHESVQAAASESAGPSWVIAAPNPQNPRTLPDFRMFAVLGTWMEEDVVAATVRNALAQGCECVYLVDNGSTDGTVDAALREGAILGRSFRTDQYDEGLRLRHMNDVVSEVSLAEGHQHIWWLYLDADEFPHGPWGITLREYLATLDEKFRIVGTRFFNHYPSGAPHYEPGRHPLDFQPLCEELAFPMCAERHRKHPLLRFDHGRAPIECGIGFHAASCAEQLYEPTQPAFLHHFPFRDETITRKRLESLWAKDAGGATRAVESRDTHILTRFRSINAVYAQDWARVENFIALDPLNSIVKATASGVQLKPWTEMVETEHQPVFRWYATSMTGAWKYENAEKFRYGDDTTYKMGIAFLDGHGLIEDWGCGFAHARSFVTQSAYRGIDGSSQHADEIVDLRAYRSQADCILMRHVLEHNTDWSQILANAVASFRKRMALIIFTPLSEATRVIATSTSVTAFPVPDISFRREDLTAHFQHLTYSEESLRTDTQYGAEHVFYISKSRNSSLGAGEPMPIDQYLEQEFNAGGSAGLTAKFWWRDDDAITDTPQLRCLPQVAAIDEAHRRMHRFALPGLEKSPPRILAFNDPWHDSSFCMVDSDGLTHVECERFTRVKSETVNPVLVFCEMFPDRLDEFSTVVIEESNNALASFIRRVIAARADGTSDPSTLLPFMPYGAEDSRDLHSCPPVYEDTPQVKEFIRHLLRSDVDIFFCGHHAAHAANAYYSSGFDAALTVTLDGIGFDYVLGTDRRTLTTSAETARTLPINGSVFVCEGRRCEPLHQVTNVSFGFAWARTAEHILGLAEGEEGTVMAMAALGDSRRFREDICEPWIWLPTPDGWLDPHLNGCLTSFFSRLRDQMVRDQDRFDLAAALQEATEERFKRILDRFITLEQRDLCLAGGSMLNCQMVGKVSEWFPHLGRVFVPPAPYDGGICIGATQRVLHQTFGLGNPWSTTLAPYAMGAPFSRLSIVAACRSAKVTMIDATPRDICVLLQQGKVVGWFNGAAESGRRALGHRSILADPRVAGMKERLNTQIKHRQWFRPFAPMILSENVADWFDCAADFRTPYMSFAVPVRAHCREQVPAIVHFDGSARVQTVHRDLSPVVHALLTEWQSLSGIPLLLNTSFNDREPIVETPTDALNTMARARLDGVYFADAKILAMPAARAN